MRKDDSDITLLTLLIAASPNPRSCADKKPSHGAACEGCEHLWWEHDMGKSIPHCKLGMEMATTCEGFKANSLYVSYIDAPASVTKTREDIIAEYAAKLRLADGKEQ